MISNVCEGANIGVPDMATRSAHFEPVAWWWARKQIGRDLRERYEVPKDLPAELLTLVRKLDAWCAPMSTVMRHHVKTRPPA